MNQEKIGLFIKELRSNKKITQMELAKKLHVTDRAVSKWERGKGIPDISLLEDLSNILDVSILELLKGERHNKKEVKEINILDAIKYAKYDKKEFVKNLINTICLMVILIVGFSLSIENIRSIYYQNKVYTVNNSYENNYNIEETYKVIVDNINLIKNNQGSFSDEDYEQIINLIAGMEKYQLDYNNDMQVMAKNKFTLKDITKTLTKQERFRFDFTSIPLLLLKYDYNVYSKLYYIDYLILNTYYNDNLDMVEYYTLNNDFSKCNYDTLVNQLYSKISAKYSIIEKITECIIEVGGYNEEV